MLCSTIIPTVNRSTLAQTVNSVVEQGLSPEEHEILIFNNSGKPLPNESWLLAPHIKIVNSYSNTIDATNRGLLMASGKYVKILHDDDYLLPGALKALIAKAEETGCCWVYGSYQRIDNDGALMSTDRPTCKGNVFPLMLAGEGIHLAPSLMNRQAFLDVGGMHPEIIRYDQDMNIAFALISDFAYTDQIVACVRIGRQGSTVDWSKITADSRRIRERWLDHDNIMPKILDGMKGNVYLRGRICRNYLFSAVLNLKAGHLSTAAKRLIPLLSLTSFYFVHPSFWQGLTYRNYWHAVEKRKEEEHFATLQSANPNNSRR